MIIGEKIVYVLFIFRKIIVYKIFFYNRNSLKDCKVFIYENGIKIY